MGAELIPEGRYLPVDLSEWGIVAHWVFADDGGKYLAVRAQCEELGVQAQRQLQKLADPEDYPEGTLREFRIETAGGRQVVRCVRKREAAIWLGTILPSKVKPEFRQQIEQIRNLIIMAADRIVFGDMTDVRAVATIPPQGGILHLGGCPKCRAQLGVRFGPDGIVLYIAS